MVLGPALKNVVLKCSGMSCAPSVASAVPAPIFDPFGHPATPCAPRMAFEHFLNLLFRNLNCLGKRKSIFGTVGFCASGAVRTMATPAESTTLRGFALVPAFGVAVIFMS